jgi:hypothetical protein
MTGQRVRRGRFPDEVYGPPLLVLVLVGSGYGL